MWVLKDKCPGQCLPVPMNGRSSCLAAGQARSKVVVGVTRRWCHTRSPPSYATRARCHTGSSCTIGIHISSTDKAIIYGKRPLRRSLQYH